MRNSPWYIALLVVFIGSVMGCAYAESETREIYISDKHTQDGRGRRGSTTTVYILETDRGPMKILKFPIIGYNSGVKDVYNGVEIDAPVKARIGYWPPKLISAHAKPVILSIYK